MDLGSIGKELGNMGQLEQLWTDLHDHNWDALLQVVEQHRQSGDIDSGTLDKVESAAQDAKSSGEPFPSDAGQMVDFIKSKL